MSLVSCFCPCAWRVCTHDCCLMWLKKLSENFLLTLWWPCLWAVECINTTVFNPDYWVLPAEAPIWKRWRVSKLVKFQHCCCYKQEKKKRKVLDSFSFCLPGLCTVHIHVIIKGLKLSCFQTMCNCIDYWLASSGNPFASFTSSLGINILSPWKHQSRDQAVIIPYRIDKGSTDRPWIRFEMHVIERMCKNYNGMNSTWGLKWHSGVYYHIFDGSY